MGLFGGAATWGRAVVRGVASGGTGWGWVGASVMAGSLLLGALLVGSLLLGALLAERVSSGVSGVCGTDMRALLQSTPIRC